MGWIYTLGIILVLLVAVILMRRMTAKQWWENFVILAMGGLLISPIERFATGDVSRFLPDFFSEGPDGKDQVIYASIGATILVPMVLACLIWLVLKTVFKVKCS